MDVAVKINLDIKEFPKLKQVMQENPAPIKDQVTPVKFAMTRDKFLQLTRDMKQALGLVE